MPHLTWSSYEGDYVPFSGYGFFPGAPVRVELLSPTLQLLGVLYVNADVDGFISGTVYVNSVHCFGGGSLFVAGDGEPGPTAWAQSAVAPTSCPSIRWVRP
jgi:hypothetical protein